MNLDELDEKENLGFENNFKEEDILIDFNSDVSSGSAKGQPPKDFLSRHNELAGLKFEEGFKSVFDGSPEHENSTSEPISAPPAVVVASTSAAATAAAGTLVGAVPPPRPPPPVVPGIGSSSTTSKITRDLFEMDDPEDPDPPLVVNPHLPEVAEQRLVPTAAEANNNNNSSSSTSFFTAESGCGGGGGPFFQCSQLVKPESIEPIRRRPFADQSAVSSSTFFSAYGGAFSSSQPASESLVSNGSKYYSPPTESGCLETQSIKGAPAAHHRYYSSVCSNACDFAGPEPLLPSSSYSSYLAGQAGGGGGCQCCGDFFGGPCSSSVSSWNMANGPVHGYNGCDMYSSSQPPTYFPPADALPPPPPPPPPPPDFDSSQQHCSQALDESGKPNATSAYQTKVCKDFIEELEANFARLGQGVVKMGEQEGQNGATNGASSSSTVLHYPTINPPPRPYKTRRPAPPPPTQKKIT